MAQSGGALRSGRRGRWFESSRPDHVFPGYVAQMIQVLYCFIPGQNACQPSGTARPFEVAFPGRWRDQYLRQHNHG